MWIDAGYYNELLNTLEGFARGSFNFEEKKFEKFRGKKYQKLTKALVDVKTNVSNHIEESIHMVDEFIEGEYPKTNKRQKKVGDYQRIYDKYFEFAGILDEKDHGIRNIQKYIMEEGKLDVRMGVSNFKGRWLDNINLVNEIIGHFTQNLNEISWVMGNVAQGDLSQKITVDAKGEVLELKNTVNIMVDQLSQFAAEVTRVAKEVGTDGLLGGQARVDGVSGIWLDLTNNVNRMADSLTAQVRNIADVTTAVAQGDLSQKITVDAKGEVLELKNTVNIMVDQLSQFAAEVTRVAKEVGTDGLLGGQARVDGVSGIWLDLTNNVNSMADSLTTQVRSISEVAVAVASGDLTRNIDIEVKGEFLDLKKSMNTMIANLAQVDIANKSQNWIKDGVSILSKEILYKDSLSEQFGSAITQLSRYINAGMGAIYMYNTAENTLELEASYASSKRQNMVKAFKMGEGVIGQVAKDKKPILITAESENHTITTGTTRYRVVSTYTSPLVFKDALVGVVEIAAYEPFTPLQLEYLESAHAVLSGSFYASLQVREKRRLEEISIKDALTGLFNRGHFDEVVPQIINKERRNDGLICFSLLDIDHFKNFNDTYGHQVGDEVLKKVAGALKENISREGDLCFRVGGEEFAVIFSAVNKKKAFDFMTRVKDCVEELKLKNEQGESISNITISIGLTCKRAGDIKDFETLFEETDKLLYQAKENGRNRVVQND